MSTTFEEENKTPSHFTPTCGWKKDFHLTTNAPWNEKSLKKSKHHVLYHLKLRAEKIFSLNKLVLTILLMYVVLLITATITHLLKIDQTILAVLPLMALLIGLGLKDAAHEVKVESFQMWLHKAYNTQINYVEAVLALTAFYHGVERYVLPNGGTVQRVPNGLIYVAKGKETTA